MIAILLFHMARSKESAVKHQRNRSGIGTRFGFDAAVAAHYVRDRSTR
ncbi:unnamed protein product [Gongylonema pulchrum]|uniref:Uncharacterized protein n=1 Tax=Gongylonema pulchrum TaxID=637853 RepID=A0A3P6TEH4_9BILA|nr:unnamed protein product [Gongylonema pulchrum]